jgi:hypothetical protein
MEKNEQITRLKISIHDEMNEETATTKKPKRGKRKIKRFNDDDDNND